MTTHTTDTPISLNLRAKWGRFFAGLKQGFITYVERRSRADEIERLNAMSDDELAELGIKRDKIVHYVFRDMFYV